VDRVLPALGRAQEGIALTMPQVAKSQAAEVAKRSGGSMKRTLLVSSPALSRADRLHDRLPIESGAYEVLCARAGEDVAEVAFEPFPFGQWLASVTGSMVSSFPTYFCGGQTRPSVADEQPAIDEQCDLRREAHEQESDREFDTDQCRQDVRQQLAGAFGEAADGAGPRTGDLASSAPMQVAAPASNGGERMQLWGVAVGDPSTLRAAEAGVRVALWSHPGPSPAPVRGRVGLAQAELYYDTDRLWNEVREEALWNMRWRARLRRFRPTNAGIARELAAGLDGASAELRDALSGAAELIH
jgi:hypothetical protein